MKANTSKFLLFTHLFVLLFPFAAYGRNGAMLKKLTTQ